MCGEPENLEHDNMSSRPPAGELPEVMITPISFLEIGFLEIRFLGRCQFQEKPYFRSPCIGNPLYIGNPDRRGGMVA